MQAGSEWSGGLGTPGGWNPPEPDRHLVSQANEQERIQGQASPKEKNRSWCAKNGEELLEATTMMTARQWDQWR